VINVPSVKATNIKPDRFMTILLAKLGSEVLPGSHRCHPRKHVRARAGSITGEEKFFLLEAGGPVIDAWRSKPEAPAKEIA
jgi:hypothetical protein